MATEQLRQIETMVESLEPPELARLLEFLAPRVARCVTREPGASASRPGEDAWAAFFRTADELSRMAPARVTSTTQAVSDMRR
jgi:hypothetical protein